MQSGSCPGDHPRTLPPVPLVHHILLYLYCTVGSLQTCHGLIMTLSCSKMMSLTLSTERPSRWSVRAQTDYSVVRFCGLAGNATRVERLGHGPQPSRGHAWARRPESRISHTQAPPPLVCAPMLIGEPATSPEASGIEPYKYSPASAMVGSYAMETS